MTNLLLDEFQDMSGEEIRQTATMLQNSSSVLFRLIENLLQWSRVQLGSLNIEPVETDLQSLLEESLLLVKEAAAKKNVEIQNNIFERIPLVADPNILQTVLRNLLFNAVKFTRKGGVVSVTAYIRNETELVVKIKDNGIGMRAEVLDMLFEKGYHTTTRGTDGESGTGLGLVLCKELLERHKGRLWATSEPEKGSSFSFSVPMNIGKT
jgi:signal transduction histidine kinase